MKNEIEGFFVVLLGYVFVALSILMYPIMWIKRRIL